jgi:hypothetical protein
VARGLDVLNVMSQLKRRILGQFMLEI